MATNEDASRFSDLPQYVSNQQSGRQAFSPTLSSKCRPVRGVPFNIASYALLTMILAQVSGLKPGEFIHTFGDVHIYENHIPQFKEQLKRKPHPFPMIKLIRELRN